ncbi:MAG: hypothetical protein DRJ26_03520, partial [Candidatus Methanomethylicota archaeon]
MGEKAVDKRMLMIAAAVIIIIIVGVAAYFLMQPKPTEVKEIKIGVILPLSGKLAETGADLKRGIEFA